MTSLQIFLKYDPKKYTFLENNLKAESIGWTMIKKTVGTEF